MNDYNLKKETDVIDFFKDKTLRISLIHTYFEEPWRENSQGWDQTRGRRR